MPDHSLITQQIIDKTKLQRTKELRHEMTPAERKLWDLLRDSQLKRFHFRRQQIIEPYIVDFYCHAANIAIEVDGEIHMDQADYDRERDQFLDSLGIHVLRFSNAEVFQNSHGVIAEILQSCQSSSNQG